MKRVVITGTHGVGKTSLCDSLLRRLSRRCDVKVVPETARALIARGIPMNYRVDEFGIVAYVSLYLENLRKALAELVISDRSIFDLFAYVSKDHPADMRPEFLQLAKELAYLEMREVDLFIYLPIEFPMEIDDVRPSELTYQKEIDERIRELLRSGGARFIQVGGSLEQRTDAVLKFLDG